MRVVVHDRNRKRLRRRRVSLPAGSVTAGRTERDGSEGIAHASTLSAVPRPDEPGQQGELTCPRQFPRRSRTVSRAVIPRGARQRFPRNSLSGPAVVLVLCYKHWLLQRIKTLVREQTARKQTVRNTGNHPTSGPACSMPIRPGKPPGLKGYRWTTTASP